MSHHLPAAALPFCVILKRESNTKEVTIIRRISSFILSFVIILGLASFPIKAQAATATSAAGIVDTSNGNLNIRSSASTNGSVLKKVPDGSYITLISKSGEWWYVEYGKNQYGWCHSSYIKSAASSPRAVYTDSGNLNVRAGAGTSYAKTGSVASGETVLVLSSSGYWSRILYHGTKTGWVNNVYLGAVSSDSTNKAVNLSVPSFKQYDSRWANVKIGSYGKTMKQIGCATTALAMMESYRTGTTITPLDMTYRVGYTASGSIYWPSHYRASTSSSGYLSNIYTLLKSGKPVLLGLKNSSGGQHWVVVKGFSGGSITAANFSVLDPGSGWRTNLQQILNSFPSFYKYFNY